MRYRISRTKLFTFVLLCWANWMMASEPLLTLRLPEDFLPNWTISGTNTLKFEWYGHGGDTTSSPYQQGVDEQFFNALDLNLSRTVSPYERWQTRFFGVLNQSDYRANVKGLIAERFTISQEKGDFLLPYRIEAGDYFGFFTPRTLQRSLKGLQLEFQPLQSLAGERHSLQFLAGSSLQNYREGDFDSDVYYGATWMIEQRSRRLSLNLVHNRQDSNGAIARAALNQTVASLAFNQHHSILAQTLDMDAELAWFEGEIPGNSPMSQESEESLGYFFNIRGRSQTVPLRYSYRFEQYGEHFRPNGGAVSTDRRTHDLRANWQFASGINSQLRLQGFTDGLKSGNATDTRLAGVNLTGPIALPWWKGMNVSLDAFVQEIRNDDVTIDNLNRVVNFNLTAPLFGRWSARSGVLIQDQGDQSSNGDSDSRSQSYTVEFSHPLAIANLRGGISFGTAYRDVDSNSSSTQISPNFSLNLYGGPHRFQVSTRSSIQDFLNSGSNDIDNYNMGLSYEFRIGRHTLRFEGDLARRDPDRGRETDSYRVGMSYIFTFSRPPVKKVHIPTAPLAKPTPTHRELRLAYLPPGSPMTEIHQRLIETHHRDGVSIGNAQVFEVRMFPEFSQRQRLVLVIEGDRLLKSAVLIDLDPNGDLVSIRETYERLRSILSKRHGAPHTFEEDEFTANLFNDVNNDRFIRISEWSTPHGTLRLGIPRRLDGQVRIELQHAESFPPPSQTLWSVEEIH